MSPSDALLLGLVGLLVFNNFLLRLPAWLHRAWLFWPCQVLNLLAGIYLMAVGIPGFEGSLGVVNWVIGLLFLWHVIQNNGRLVEAKRAAAAQREGEEDARRKAISAALQAGEAGGAAPAEGAADGPAH
jgi:hypothetical protein